MAAPKAPLLDAAGKSSKDVTLEEAVFAAEVKPHVVHETVRAELNDARSATRGGKSRGLVAGGRSKPWRQKGTGRARAGSIRAPHWTGGGMAFPPNNRSFASKVNRKARRAAMRSAARRALRLTFPSKLRMVGGNARPPPVQCGARIEPARARPVPFWRHGLERPPATKPRLLAPRVPARAAFSSARTVSCTRCAFGSMPKTASSSVRLLADLPALSSTGAFKAPLAVPPSGRAGFARASV